MIEVKNISKQFDEKIIFNNFNYIFEKGKSYALVGTSGSGKTTLLNMIAKLDTPEKGSILIENKDLTKIKEHYYFKNYLSYLFQNYGLIDNESIFYNLSLSFINKSKSNQKRDMLDALQKVGLRNISLERKIFSLSGGEAQRVALAKMLIKDTPIILADEPTGSLDPITGKEITDLLLNCVNEDRVIIIATHNEEVWEKVDEIIDLSNPSMTSKIHYIEYL